MNLIEKMKSNYTIWGKLTDEEKQCLVDNRKHAQELWCNTTEEQWYSNASLSDRKFADVLRINPDYQPEPEILRFEIKRDKFNDLRIIMEGKSHVLHTQAPSLCPEEGYVFAGYGYEDGTILNTPTYCCPSPANTQPLDLEFPIAVIYRRVK